MKKLPVIIVVALSMSYLMLALMGVHLMPEGFVMSAATVEDMPEHQVNHDNVRCVFQGVCIMASLEHFQYYKNTFTASLPGVVLLASMLLLGVGAWAVYQKMLARFLKEVWLTILERTENFAELFLTPVPRIFNPVLQTFAKRHPQMHA